MDYRNRRRVHCAASLIAVCMGLSVAAFAQEAPAPANDDTGAGAVPGDAATSDASTSDAATGDSATSDAAASDAATAAFENPPDVSQAPTIPVAGPAPAPLPVDPSGPTRLDEVYVTAQKVKQSARDVPISMSVLNDSFVAEHGIVDIVQAMQYVPNVKISSGGFFAAPQARGFSFNNNNKAFESPLGIAFDGIPYTNTTYFNAGLFDIQRVEVLRGPQGTTFGKNTTAGLVSIITADPTPEFSGVASLQYGQLGHKHVEAAFGGPLWDDAVEFRIAGIYDDIDGFVRDTTADVVPGIPAKLRGFQHKGYRAKLKFPDLFGSDLKLQYESVDLNNTGAGVEMWTGGQAFRDYNKQYDPNVDFTLGNNVNSEDGPDYRKAHANTALGEWNIPLGAWTATALGGYSVLSETVGVDVEFSPTPGLNGYGRDRFPTSTLELRAVSPTLDGLFGLPSLFGLDLGHTEFLGGFFFQRRAITDSDFDFVLNDGPFLGETGAADTDFYGRDPLVTLGGIPLPGGLINPLTVQGKQDEFDQGFVQSGSVIALFQQTQWKFLPRWVLQLGLRASLEKKTGDWNLVFRSPPPSTLLTALGLQEFQATRSIRETQLQPKVSLNYQPTDKVSLFAHWTKGFKGGGFNAFAYRPDDTALVYRPETTTEWGLDLKTGYFFDGAVKTNLSLYRMNAHDFQVLGREKPPVVGIPGVNPVCTDSACFPPSVIGLGTTRVFNAPKAYAQGVEAELNVMVWEGLSLFGTLGYNDTKYVDFKQNECPASNSHATCDATGRPFPFAPRWDATLTPRWIFNLPWGLSLTPTFTAQYLSSQLLDTDVGEEKRQKGFLRYNASLALGDLARGWSFQVIGKNLTDKRTSVRYGDIFAGVLVSVPESSREVLAQFRWAF